MGYYTRVLSKRADGPTFDELQTALRKERADVKLTMEDGEASEWTSLLLCHDDGLEIAEIERNAVAPDSLGEEEVAEFIEAVADGQPASAAAWLTAYLPEVKVIYAFRHLSGTEQRQGAEALGVVRSAIWARGDAILQADGEGYTNEDGYHVLWEFSDGVSGPWSMAVLQDAAWVPFQMELGDRGQRAAFLDGRVPPGVKTTAVE